MKDRCNECRYKMERHGIIDGEDVYYCDICGIYQSYPLEEEALLAAEKGDFFKPLTQSEMVTISCDECKHEEDYSTKDLVSFNEQGFPTCSKCYPKFNQGVDKPNSYSIIREHSAAEKKNCGCGKDPCVTYGAESEKKPEKDHNCIACGHHSAHITMGDDKFCYDCYHYAETFGADGIREGKSGSILNFEFDEEDISWEDEVLPLITEYTDDWNAQGIGFGEVSVSVRSPRKVMLEKLKADLDNELGGYIYYGAETFASFGGKWNKPRVIEDVTVTEVWPSVTYDIEYKGKTARLTQITGFNHRYNKKMWNVEFPFDSWFDKWVGRRTNEYVNYRTLPREQQEQSLSDFQRLVDKYEAGEPPTRNVFEAETFNSYKVAPELSSYTVDELVDSIAGPQGSAAYDEMVYDPIAQDRQSAESFSLPHTVLLLGGIVAGLGFGVFLTKKLGDITLETSDEGGA